MASPPCRFRILTATLPYKQRASDPAELRRHFDFTENVNYKLVPHVDGTPAIRQLTAPPEPPRRRRIGFL